MRRRATSGEMARGGLVFVFFFGGCSDVGGGFFHRLGSGWHEGVGFCFFLWGLLRCRRDVDHGSGHAAPCHLRRDGTRGLVFVFFFGDCSGVGGMLTTGVVMRRRATTGVDGTRGLVFVFLWRLLRCRRGILSHAQEWMARGRLVFVFFLEVAPVSEGDSFTGSGVDGTRVNAL